MEARDRVKYDEVWATHEDDAGAKIEKPLSATKVVHKQLVRPVMRIAIKPSPFVDSATQLVCRGAPYKRLSKIPFSSVLATSHLSCCTRTRLCELVKCTLRSTSPRVATPSIRKLQPKHLSVAVVEA